MNKCKIYSIYVYASEYIKNPIPKNLQFSKFSVLSIPNIMYNLIVNSGSTS